MQALDFSKMDLSEFYAEIQPKMPDVNVLSTTNQQVIQQKVNNYYQQ
jgi:conjugal transfer mating pair stabilization protein TraN